MKGILEFTLPEDRESFNCAAKADEACIALSIYKEFLHQRIKHHNCGTEVCHHGKCDVIKELEYIRTELLNLLEEKDLLGVVNV